MNTIGPKILAGAVTGFSASLAIDLHAFEASPDLLKKFDWKLAFTRYAMGAVMGALAGAGFGAVQP